MVRVKKDISGCISLRIHYPRDRADVALRDRWEPGGYTLQVLKNMVSMRKRFLPSNNSAGPKIPVETKKQGKIICHEAKSISLNFYTLFLSGHIEKLSDSISDVISLG